MQNIISKKLLALLSTVAALFVGGTGITGAEMSTTTQLAVAAVAAVYVVVQGWLDKRKTAPSTAFPLAETLGALVPLLQQALALKTQVSMDATSKSASDETSRHLIDLQEEIDDLEREQADLLDKWRANAKAIQSLNEYSKEQLRQMTDYAQKLDVALSQVRQGLEGDINKLGQRLRDVENVCNAIGANVVAGIGEQLKTEAQVQSDVGNGKASAILFAVSNRLLGRP